MRKMIVAALALAVAAPLVAQTSLPDFSVATPLVAPASMPDFSVATPLPGRWSFLPGATGGDAVFADTAGRPQLTLRCTRATRQISLIKPAGAAVPAITVWTSSTRRAVATVFNPATASLRAEFAATDPLLDAMAFSRGRFAISVAPAPALVVPAWPEVSRVVEECRA